jgi:hypothetical protein
VAIPSDELDLSFSSPEEKSAYLAEWLDFAGRGLYSYDSTRSGPRDAEGLRILPYFLVARPLRELLIQEVPDEIASIVRRVQYTTRRFSESTVITETDIFKNWKHLAD